MAPDLEALRTRYLSAQLEGNRREALRILVEEGLGNGATVEALQTDVVRVAQMEIGRLWQENRITIAQEHMATAISQLALARLFESAKPAPRNGVKAMVACVDGELHEFPARLVADRLDLAGFEVRYVGANVPSTALVALIQQEHPDFVALSVTMTFNVPALRAAMAEIRKTFGKTMPVIIGGNVSTFAPDLATEVGADAMGFTADELIEFGEALRKKKPRPSAST